jgi:hypothetical protein
MNMNNVCDCNISCSFYIAITNNLREPATVILDDTEKYRRDWRAHVEGEEGTAA